MAPKRAKDHFVGAAARGMPVRDPYVACGEGGGKEKGVKELGPYPAHTEIVNLWSSYFFFSLLLLLSRRHCYRHRRENAGARSAATTVAAARRHLRQFEQRSQRTADGASASASASHPGDDAAWPTIGCS